MQEDGISAHICQGGGDLTYGRSQGTWLQGRDDQMESKSLCLPSPFSQNSMWHSRSSMDVGVRWTKVSNLSTN